MRLASVVLSTSFLVACGSEGDPPAADAMEEVEVDAGNERDPDAATASVVPSVPSELQVWLAAGSYSAFAAESAPHPSAGFLDEHSQDEVVEDKATVFQHLMARPDELCARAANDDRLAAKARLLEARVGAITGSAFVADRAACLAAPPDVR